MPVLQGATRRERRLYCHLVQCPSRVLPAGDAWLAVGNPGLCLDGVSARQCPVRLAVWMPESNLRCSEPPQV